MIFILTLVPGLFGKTDDEAEAVVSKSQFDKAQRELDKDKADLETARLALSEAKAKAKAGLQGSHGAAGASAEITTIEGAERRLESMRNTLYDTVKRTAILEIALEMGFRDANEMYKLIPMAQIGIDDSDPKHPAVSSVEDVSALMKELATDSPYLLNEGAQIENEEIRNFGGSTNPANKGQPGPRKKKFATLEIKRLQGEIDSGDFTGTELLQRRHELQALTRASRAAGIGKRSKRTGLSLTERLARKTSQLEREALTERNRSLSAQYGKK